MGGQPERDKQEGETKRLEGGKRIRARERESRREVGMLIFQVLFNEHHAKLAVGDQDDIVHLKT